MCELCLPSSGAFPCLVLPHCTLSNTHRLMTTAARGSTCLTTASLEQRLGRGTLTRRSGRTVWGRRDTCLRTYPSRTMRSTVEIRSRREPQRRDQRHRCLQPPKSRYREEESLASSLTANSLTTNDPIAYSLPTKPLTTNDLIAHSLPAKSPTTNSLTAKSLTLPAIACIVTLRLLFLYARTDPCVSITNSRELTMS